MCGWGTSIHPSTGRLTIGPDIVKERISEPEDRSVEISSAETQREKIDYIRLHT